MQTLEAIDVDLLLDLEELDDLPCGDGSHPSGESFHTPEAPAAYLLLNPCCGDRLLLCESRARYLKYRAAQIRCASCGREWAPGAYRFVPLPGVTPL